METLRSICPNYRGKITVLAHVRDAEAVQVALLARFRSAAAEAPDRTKQASKGFADGRQPSADQPAEEEKRP